MSQHDYVIANATFPNTRSDNNNVFDAILTNNSGASAPSTTGVYQIWVDTTNNVIKRRDSADSAWYIIATSDNDRFITKTGAYTVLLTDYDKTISCSTGSSYTITLLAAATAGDNFQVTIVKSSSDNNTLTIDGNSSETINGSTTHELRGQYEAVTLVCDGANWFIKGRSTQVASNPNILHNGDFKISQRGTSFTSATTPANDDAVYLFDNHVLLSDGNNIADVTLTSGTTGSAYGIKFDQETANKQYGNLTPVNNANTVGLRNSNVTFAMNIHRGANTTAFVVRMAIIEWTSTGDAITRDCITTWNADGTNPTLATNWAYISTPQNITVTTTSVRHHTVATVGASANNLGLLFWLDDSDGTVTDTISITALKFERGLVPTPFQSSPISVELLACQRRYYKRNGARTIGAGYFNSTTEVKALITHPVTMDSLPTMSSSATTAWDVERPGTSTSNTTGNSFGTITTTDAIVTLTGASVSVLGYGSAARIEVSESFEASSEL